MRLVTILLVLSCCAVASAQDVGPRAPNREPASADDEVARNLFHAGKTAFEAGDFEDALRYFEDAHARSHRPELLYNVAQAADRLRNDQKALAAFKSYLAALPDAENRAEVENRIRALERTREAPTPRETAQAATPNEAAAPLTAGSDDKAITGQWWFWSLIGAVVVGGVITAVALSAGDTQQGPIDSNTGITVATLQGAR